MTSRLLHTAHGQATIETVALVPLILVVALGALQLLAVGYAGVLAGGAAEAGALALAGEANPRAAVREALPGWTRARTRVTVKGGRVVVRLRPPAPLRRLADALELRASAAVESP